jgi:hypothetical protein
MKIPIIRKIAIPNISFEGRSLQLEIYEIRDFQKTNVPVISIEGKY